MSDLKLVPLKTAIDEAQESVVNLAEELLEKAKSGEIVEIVAATVHADGHISSLANQTEFRSRRIGAAAQLLHDLCSKPSDR
jgi:hypothetical protein